jgi:hypothetical protein
MRTLALGVLVTTATAPALFAGEHFVVITTLTHGSHDRAVVDVATEVPAEVVIQIQPSGASVLLTLDLPTLAATSDDLWALTGGATALARIATVDPTVRSSVVLRHETSTTNVVLGVPDSRGEAGGLFHLPVGTLGPRSFVLIGNPNPTDVDFLYGYGFAAMQPGRVNARSALRLDLPGEGTRFVLATGGGTASPPLILQYGNDLKDLVETFVPQVF